MRFEIPLTIALFGAGALSTCQMDTSSGDKTWCDWKGSSPLCGSTDYAVNDKDARGDIMRASTAYYSARGLYDRGMITKDCYNDYGAGCVEGYKRLWCGRA